MDETASQPCESVAITLRGKRVEGAWRAGESLLQTAMRFGFMPSYSCLSGDCAACIARVTEGAAVMDTNECLSDEEVARGYVLTCQAKPVGAHVEIAYEE